MFSKQTTASKKTNKQTSQKAKSRLYNTEFTSTFSPLT